MTRARADSSDEDVEPFRALFTTTYADLMRFTERRVHPLAAEEVVAEVFLVAWRRRHDTPQDARPWLFGIARNVILNRRREDRRRAALQVRVNDEPASAGTSDPADQIARHLDLLSAWKNLDERDQETIALVAWDHLTPAQAAAVVGCSRGTFAVRLHRARTRLRRHLDGQTASPANPPHDWPATTESSARTKGAPR